MAGESPSAHRAADKGAFRQPLLQLVGVLAHIDEDEVGRARDHGEAQLRETASEVVATGKRPQAFSLEASLTRSVWPSSRRSCPVLQPAMYLLMR